MNEDTIRADALFEEKKRAIGEAVKYEINIKMLEETRPEDNDRIMISKNELKKWENSLEIINSMIKNGKKTNKK